MNRVKVVSSMFLAVSYNPQTHLLELELQNGQILHCFDVPETLFRHMVAAPSQGRFYHRWISDIFETHVHRDIGGRYLRRTKRAA